MALKVVYLLSWSMGMVGLGLVTLEVYLNHNDAMILPMHGVAKKLPR